MAKSAVSLRVFGDNLDPTEITALLGAKPSTSYCKGDLVSPGRSLTIRKHGMWSLKAEDAEPEAFDAQIQGLLARLPDDLNIWRSLADRYQVDLFCGFFMDTTNQGFTLSTKTMACLAERSIEIGFDVYSPSPEE
jgi:Domain of unknown function (DUF4279)